MSLLVWPEASLSIVATIAAAYFIAESILAS